MFVFSQSNFTLTFYIAERNTNRWLNANLYSAEVRVILGTNDVHYVYNQLEKFTKNCLPANFNISSNDAVWVTVLYDSQAYYNEKEVDKALQKLGQEAANRRNLLKFKVGNRFFTPTGRQIVYVNIDNIWKVG